MSVCQKIKFGAKFKFCPANWLKTTALEKCFPPTYSNFWTMPKNATKFGINLFNGTKLSVLIVKYYAKTIIPFVLIGYV